MCIYDIPTWHGSKKSLGTTEMLIREFWRNYDISYYGLLWNLERMKYMYYWRGIFEIVSEKNYRILCIVWSYFRKLKGKTCAYKFVYLCMHIEDVMEGLLRSVTSGGVGLDEDGDMITFTLISTQESNDPLGL